jgi:hypothetical protein
MLAAFCLQSVSSAAEIVSVSEVEKYADGRPSARFRLEAKDQGIVLRHGNGPDRCDVLGARDVWVYQAGDIYYMNYDGAGPKGWLACLATSTNLTRWTLNGPVLDFGQPGQDDSASASYGVTFFDGQGWHMFYLGTPHTSPAPDLIPAFPYLTMRKELRLEPKMHRPALGRENRKQTGHSLRRARRG